METIIKNHKTLTYEDFKNHTDKRVLDYSKNHSNPIVAMTKGWQCCKCKEEMYRDEDNCNWNRCNHRRCSSCRSFQV